MYRVRVCGVLMRPVVVVSIRMSRVDVDNVGVSRIGVC